MRLSFFASNLKQTVRSILSLLIVFTLCGAPISLSAKLEFETQTLSLKSAPGADEISSSFVFKNTGRNPISIISTHTPCDCTTARSTQDAIAPGESGVINFDFRFGERTGEQEKEIILKTDEASDQEYRLKFHVSITPAVALSTHRLVWTRSAALEKKTVTIQLDPELPLKLVRIKTLDKWYTFEQRPSENPQTLLIDVTPTNTRPETGNAGRMFLIFESDNKARYGQWLFLLQEPLSGN